jgi:7-carboxy-7-deazaguanine synthase
VRFENVDSLRAGDNVKFVIADQADFDWMVRQITRLHLARRDIHLLASPVFGRCKPADLAAWILDSGLPVRLQLQLHRILWPDGERTRC